MRLAVLTTTLSEEPFPESLENFAHKARDRGHSCALIRYGELVLGVSAAGEATLEGSEVAALSAADLVIPKLSYLRPNRGDYYVLDWLRHRGIPFLNSITAIETARNKLTAIQVLAAAGVPVPATAVARRLEMFPVALAKAGPGPWVIKPAVGSRGRDICLAATAAEVEAIALRRWEQDRHEILLFQELLSTPDGQPWDIRVFVLLGEVVGAMRRDAPPGDFRANFSLGGRVSPLEIPTPISLLALRSAQVLGLDLAGVDIIHSPRDPVVVEVNGNPGWEGIASAMAQGGKDFHSTLLDIIERHCPPERERKCQP